MKLNRKPISCWKSQTKTFSVPWRDKISNMFSVLKWKEKDFTFLLCRNIKAVWKKLKYFGFTYIIVKVQSHITSLQTSLDYSTILNHLNELKWNNISCHNLCLMIKSWATLKSLFARLRWLWKDGGSKSCSKLVRNHWTNAYLPINMKLKQIFTRDSGCIKEH